MLVESWSTCGYVAIGWWVIDRDREMLDNKPEKQGQARQGDFTRKFDNNILTLVDGLVSNRPQREMPGNKPEKGDKQGRICLRQIHSLS